MISELVANLRAAVDELAAAEVVGLSQREDVAALWRELARLDAQFARRVGEFDRSAAWESGAITSRHVDALTRVRHAADADEYFAVFEPVLVDVARRGRPEDVANSGQQWRDALDSHLDRDGASRRDAKAHERRGLDFSKSFDGVGFLKGTLGVDDTEIVDTALRRLYQQHHAEHDPRSPRQQRADALVELCRQSLDRQGRGANRPHVIVTVDVETLAGEGVGCCETISGYRISPETARRIACDAIVQRIVVNAAGVPLEMGRTERTFTPDQHRAIMVRDGGCRFPGCEQGPVSCEAHHAMEFWEDGGPTDLANGLAICRGSGHHRLIHEGGWTVAGDPNGELTFFDPDGSPQGSTRPRSLPPPLPTRLGNEIAQAQERARELQGQLAV